MIGRDTKLTSQAQAVQSTAVQMQAHDWPGYETNQLGTSYTVHSTANVIILWGAIHQARNVAEYNEHWTAWLGFRG